MVTVSENVDLPTGADPARAVATLQLFRADGIPLLEALDTTTGKTIAGRYTITLDGVDPNSPAPGTWQLVDTLTPNVNLDVANSVWGRTLTGPSGISTVTYGIVPATAGPYKWRSILSDPPGALTSSALASHAASTTLHGGGIELGFTDIGANNTTQSTSFVDLPNAVLSFVIPARPYTVEAVIGFLMEEASRQADLRLVYGTTPSLLIQDTKYSVVAQQGGLTTLKQRVPCRTQPSPTPGLAVTYKVQWRTSSATSDLSIFVDFGGPVNEAWMQAVTC